MAEVSTTPKKEKVSRPKANHPATGVMVNAAIKELKERGGSSLQAVKKYIKIDANKLSPFIKKYIKGAVASGALIQTKGKGASGSFKLPLQNSKTKVKRSPKTIVKKTTSPKSAKPSKMKKSVKPPTKKPKTPKQKITKPKTKASLKKK